MPQVNKRGTAVNSSIPTLQQRPQNGVVQLTSLLTLQLLDLKYDEIQGLLCDQYNSCEALFKERFDLKGLTFYIHSQVEEKNPSSWNPFEQANEEFDMEKKMKMMNSWVQKCGGSMRLSLDESVHVAIVEMKKILDILKKFEHWRSNFVQSEVRTSLEDTRDSTDSPCCKSDDSSPERSDDEGNYKENNIFRLNECKP